MTDCGCEKLYKDYPSRNYRCIKCNQKFHLKRVKEFKSKFLNECIDYLSEL